MTMSPKLAMVGQIMSSLVDMAKGTMGEQFAVSIVARHRAGPCHMLIGDDTELGIINAMSALMRSGTPLIKDGEPIDNPDLDPVPQDDVVTLLRELREHLDPEHDPRDADFIGRINKFLDKEIAS